MKRDDECAIVELGEPVVDVAQQYQFDVDDVGADRVQNRRWEVVVERKTVASPGGHQAASTVRVPSARSRSMASTRPAIDSSG
jgi:hypothetical protein